MGEALSGRQLVGKPKPYIRIDFLEAAAHFTARFQHHHGGYVHNDLD